MRQSGRSDFQQVILESKQALGHWAIINGHSLAGDGRFPPRKGPRDRMKAEIFQLHVEYGLRLLDTLAKTQSKFKGKHRFHDCALTVGGDFNMTLAQTQSAVEAMEVVIKDCDTVGVHGEGSLFVVSAHTIFPTPLRKTLRGQDNGHDLLVALIEWPGWTLQDLVMCRGWWGGSVLKGLRKERS